MMGNPRWRYLLVKFLMTDAVSAQRVEQSVRTHMEEMLGKVGLSEMKARVLAVDEQKSTAMLRCDLSAVERLRAVLALMRQMDGRPVAAFTLRSSGTIKGLGTKLRQVRR
jgi:RNase P/RNase MRP subunit POP5